MIDQYCVIGNPIHHSLSPQIHAFFAESTGEKIAYSAQLQTPETFKEAIKAQLQTGQLQGANVTLPFKELAYALAEVKTARVEKAGAANTLWCNEQGQICADNTDGIGLLADLNTNLGLSLKGKRVLILGAGGAVRGVVQPMLAAGVAHIVIANRTPAKAQNIAALFSPAEVSACGFNEIAPTPFDLIINGTAASLAGELPPIPNGVIGSYTQGYDMMYGKGITPFCQWCHQQSAQAIDGLGMLVEQAAESFYIWRGVKPETAQIMAQLRQQL